MAAADDLWTAVKADYSTDGLISLTNIDDRSATTINDTVGTSASQAVINLWPIYAQQDYDQNNAVHVEIAEMGVIAMLWRRGGAATTIETVKWDTVFGSDGLLEKLKRTTARARMAPSSTSGIKTSTDADPGEPPPYGWSDPAGLPIGVRASSSTPRDVE